MLTGNASGDELSTFRCAIPENIMSLLKQSQCFDFLLAEYTETRLKIGERWHNPVLFLSPSTMLSEGLRAGDFAAVCLSFFFNRLLPFHIHIFKSKVPLDYAGHGQISLVFAFFYRIHQLSFLLSIGRCYWRERFKCSK